MGVIRAVSLFDLNSLPLASRAGGSIQPTAEAPQQRSDPGETVELKGEAGATQREGVQSFSSPSQASLEATPAPITPTAGVADSVLNASTVPSRTEFHWSSTGGIAILSDETGQASCFELASSNWLPALSLHEGQTVSVEAQPGAALETHPEAAPEMGDYFLAGQTWKQVKSPCAEGRPA